MNTLITIGYLGGKTAYLNVSREEALQRWSLENDGESPEDRLVDDFQFEDEFYTYEAGAK